MLKQLLFALVAGLFPTLAHGADAHLNYSGHYVVADKHPERIFRLTLSQNGSRVHAVFYAADLDESGVKPTGEGDGRVDDQGVLHFKFKDSLADEGTATLEPAERSYRFELRVTKFVDTSALHFYGVLTMKKTAESAPQAVVAE